MQRIYLPNTQFGEQLIISEKELYHQITRVMRARVGQNYVFFDGESLTDYVYEIGDINKSECIFSRTETIEKSSELDADLVLYQALPNKISKLETIIQKSCEVGYKKIIFFIGDNSQKLILSDTKKQRLKKIAIEAIEQCGGNIIPEIVYQDTLDILKGQIFFCHTESDNSKELSSIYYEDMLNIVIGPEGGLSQREVQGLEKAGAVRICFGKRIFRCETVAPLIGFYVAQKKES